MTPVNLAGLVVGLLVVPVWLLYAGHRIWRRPARERRFFRGAALGHCVAVVLASCLAVLPPHLWADTDVVRGALGVWSLVIFPLAGGVLAATLHNAHRDGAP